MGTILRRGTLAFPMATGSIFWLAHWCQLGHSWGDLNISFSCHHHAVCNLSSHWLWQLPVLKSTDPSSICILDLEGATLEIKNIVFSTSHVLGY